MDNVTKDTLNLISRVYDAGLSPTSWPEIIDDIACHLNAKGSSLFYSDSNNPEINPLVTCWSEYWRNQNILQYLDKIADDEPSARLLRKRKPREIMTTENITLEEKVSISEFSGKFRSMFGIDALVASRLTETGVWFDYITLQYDNHHGPVNESEISQLEILLPHVSKSLEISRPMAILEQRFSRVLEALDHFHLGVFILSEKGVCILKNNEADRIIGLTDGLLLDKNRKLRACNKEDNDRLQRSIRDAINASTKKGLSCGALRKVKRKTGKDSFLVEVSPLSNRDEMINKSHHGSIIFVIDPDEPGNVSTKGMRKLYELTLSEANVCQCVVEGYSNPEIAELRNVSPETVKTQLQSILRKTSSKSRAELIRRALSINLPIDNA